MKFTNIFLCISLIFLLAGCNTISQDNNVVNQQPIIFEMNEKSFNGFCVMTATSNFAGKIQFTDAKSYCFWSC